MFCPLNQNHVQLVLVTMNISIWLFFLCWFTLVTRLKQFFLYGNTYPTMYFNLAKLETCLSVLASTPSTIWILLLFASLCNSILSFNNPMLQSLLGQSASTCHKNDGPWNQQLLHVSFPLINSCIFFNLMDTISNKHFASFRIAPNVVQNYLAISPKSLLPTIYLQLFP